MSFFNDFLNEFGLEDETNQIQCMLVFNRCVKIMCNYKIEYMDSSEIVIKCKKEKVKIMGEQLTIKSIAKGEIEVIGKICGVTKLWQI